MAGPVLRAPSQEHDEDQSKILVLPRELRDEIYAFLFASTRLTFGKRNFGEPEGRRRQWVRIMKPAANSLAALRTCRQIYQETKDMWLGLVLFNFESAEDFIDKLSPLPANIISRIRYIRFRNLLSLSSSTDISSSNALKLIPGLQLERLTVIALGDVYYNYWEFEDFIRRTSGWRELHLFCPDPGIIRWDAGPLVHAPRQPQPSTWNAMLCDRDGTDSGPSVTMYFSKSEEDCTVTKQQNRILYEQTSATLAAPNYVREFLIVAKRGPTINIVDTVPPCQKDDFAGWKPGMTWEMMKPLYLENTGLDEDEDYVYDDHDTTDDDHEWERDQYNDVDEYDRDWAVRAERERAEESHQPS